MDSHLPTLYSFRRCPYAIRARWALYTRRIRYMHHEVLLKDKPTALFVLSPKGTVPVLQCSNGTILEESLDIMQWALQTGLSNLSDTQQVLIKHNDTVFKYHLDRYKYPNRYDDVTDPLLHRQHCEAFFQQLNNSLLTTPYLDNHQIDIADMAIAPFVRQCALVDDTWYAALPYTKVHAWLNQLLESHDFQSIMIKYPVGTPTLVAYP